jgi:putative restriction endonuclease
MGRTVSWHDIQANAENGPRLVNQAKGIYKPHYTEYALSVRQTLESPYADQEVQRRSDGSWVYPYFQENGDPAQRDKEATNRGLVKCMNDGVPVGVLLQVKPKPGVQYEILGLAAVSEWKDGYFVLEGFSSNGSVHRRDAAHDRAMGSTIATENFDVSLLDDRREKAIAEVVRRRGQAKFRKILLDAYRSTCAISRCDAAEALEAAHIRTSVPLTTMMRGLEPPPFGVRMQPAKPRKQISVRCTVLPFCGRIRRESVPTIRLPDFFASASFCLCISDIMPIRRRVSAGVCHSTP